MKHLGAQGPLFKEVWISGLTRIVFGVCRKKVIQNLLSTDNLKVIYALHYSPGILSRNL